MITRVRKIAVCLISGVVLLICTDSFSQPMRLNPACFENMVLVNQKNVNTKGLETFPCLINDTLAFVQSVDGGKDFQIVIARNHDREGWRDTRPFGKEINSPYFEGPFCWDKKTKNVLLTRSYVNKQKIIRENARRKDSVIIHLSIWEVPFFTKAKAKKLELNTEDYSYSDPAVSPDGEWLVFTSDQPGGFGGRDLYIARKDPSGWVGKANLGKEINSPANEGFAAFANDRVLFFASDRPGGLGGFDVYYTTVDNGIWAAPKLLPKPVNSPHDDLSFIVHENGKEGYLASNRPGGKGEDDIYRWYSAQPLWQMPEPVEEEVDVEIFVFEKLTLLPFPEAAIQLTQLEINRNDIRLDDPNIDIVNLDSTGSLYFKWNTVLKDLQTITIMSDNNGRARVRLHSGVYYKVESNCEVCDPEILFFKPGVHGKQLNIALQPSEADEDDSEPDTIKGIEKLSKEDVAGTVFVLDNILYEYDSDVIVSEGANDLDILVEKMEENPDISVLLESHTDTRGSEAYNLLLSVRRANNAKKYMVDRGIDETRIVTKGLGESRPRNRCKDGVSCTEAEHRYNRRTEVFILPD